MKVLWIGLVVKRTLSPWSILLVRKTFFRHFSKKMEADAVLKEQEARKLKNMWIVKYMIVVVYRL